MRSSLIPILQEVQTEVGYLPSEAIMAISRYLKIPEAEIYGVMFLPFHFAEAAANRLTNPVSDPISKIPEFKVCAVSVKKIGKTEGLR